MIEINKTRYIRLVIDPAVSMRNDDRGAVLVSGLACVPDAAGCAAAQRLDRQSQLVTGLECLARPAVPRQAVRAVAFEAPDHWRLVLAFDLQHDERVRA